MVGHDLSQNCLQRSDSDSFQFLAFDLLFSKHKCKPMPEFEKTTVSRLPPHLHSGRARYRAIICFVFFGPVFLEPIFLANGKATKPLRVKRQITFRVIARVSVWFRPFPSDSVAFRLTLSGMTRYTLEIPVQIRAVESIFIGVLLPQKEQISESRLLQL